MQKLDVSTISPQEAQAKMNDGAVLVDVREYPEWSQNHVSDATLIPLGEIIKNPHCVAVGGAADGEVLLLCGSGKRAAEAAQCLTAAGVTTAHVIDGGIKGWTAAGLPTQQAQGGPISLERQVRIGAGALVLLGLLVPKLRVISYLVPCGLVFAGVTDWCGMAKVLTKMPWNQPANGAQPSCCKNQTPNIEKS